MKKLTGIPAGYQLHITSREGIQIETHVLSGLDYQSISFYAEMLKIFIESSKYSVQQAVQYGSGDTAIEKIQTRLRDLLIKHVDITESLRDDWGEAIDDSVVLNLLLCKLIGEIPSSGYRCSEKILDREIQRIEILHYTSDVSVVTEKFMS